MEYGEAEGEFLFQRDISPGIDKKKNGCYDSGNSYTAL